MVGDLNFKLTQIHTQNTYQDKLNWICTGKECEGTHWSLKPREERDKNL